jgi:hypothetical protein
MSNLRAPILLLDELHGRGGGHFVALPRGSTDDACRQAPALHVPRRESPIRAGED